MRLFGPIAALILVFTGCGDSTSGDEGSPGPTDPTSTIEQGTSAPPPAAGLLPAAASAAQAAIEQGDSLGDCPLGTPFFLVSAIGDTAPVGPGMADDTDNGQVFSGGNVDITYCSLFDSGATDDEIGDLRIDVAPEMVDLSMYLSEEYRDLEDVETKDVDVSAIGSATAACSESGEECGVFWQGDGLFIGVVARGENPLDPDQVVAMAEALIPAVIVNLAA